MNAMRKVLVGATFLAAGATLTPRPVLAADEEQQRYECVTTTIKTSVYKTGADGTITVSESISVTTVCTPIAE